MPAVSGDTGFVFCGAGPEGPAADGFLFPSWGEGPFLAAGGEFPGEELQIRLRAGIMKPANYTEG